MDRRIEKTERAILDAYISLVKGNKGKKITISELAKTANIDRKTFYSHYESVDDILHKFWVTRIEELKQRLEEAAYFENPSNLLIIYEAMNQIMERDKEFYRLLAENGSYYFFWEKIHHLIVEAMVNAYRGIIRINETEMVMYFDFFIGGILRLYQNYLKNPEQVSSETMGKVILEIAENGLKNL